MDQTEDIELARAIELSLQETNHSRQEVIDLVSDSDDDQKQEVASRARRREAVGKPKADTSRQTTSELLQQQQSQQQSKSSIVSAFLSERAQLEKERRERQKRLRPQLDPEGSDADDDDNHGPPMKRQQLSSNSAARADSPHDRSSTASSSRVQVLNGDQLFWNGECRQTATQFGEPRKDGRPTFRLSEILGQKSELGFAIISSYSLDTSWIYEFFDRSVPVILVAQPDESGRASLKNILPNWIRTTPYLRAGHGCQHMKFMLLFYKNGRLRVIISTANLIAYDWSIMENTVWLQDIPWRTSPVPNNPKADDFPALFQHVLNSLNVRPALIAMSKDNHADLPLKSIEDLRIRWDWSKVKVQLVASIAGKHEGWPSVVKIGHPRLMMAVRKLGLRVGTGKELQLECQGSSLGLYTTQWLNEFYYSASGESAEDWLDNPRKQREKLPYPPVKIVFPTKKTVQQSARGEEGGGTIFCRRRQWSGKNFPRGHFYDSNSKAGPVLMHSKMIIATLKDRSRLSSSSRIRSAAAENDSEDDEIQVVTTTTAVGWMYVGSHNFTPSAWGTLSGSSFNPILNITNYELGVVFPLEDNEVADRLSCYKRPPRKYELGSDEPWMQEESVYHQ